VCPPVNVLMLTRRSQTTIRAQASDGKDGWKRAKASISERRRLLEQVRQTDLKNVNSDLEKIVKREMDFAKHVVEELVPIKILWRENAAKSFMDSLPFKIELKESPFKAHTTMHKDKHTHADVALVTDDPEPEISLDGPIA